MKDKIYLVGNIKTGKVYGTTKIKGIAQAFVNKYEDHSIVKMPMKKYVHKYGYDLIPMGDDYCNILNEEDETRFIEEFEQYRNDISYIYVNEFIKCIACLKFSKDELKQVRNLVRFLLEFTDRELEGVHDEYDVFTFWDQGALIEHFIKHFTDLKSKGD